jgi:hypothetical protein
MMRKMRWKGVEALWLMAVVVAAVFVAVPMNVNATPSGWSEDIRLTINDKFSRYPLIAVNGNNIHVVWQ